MSQNFYRVVKWLSCLSKYLIKPNSLWSTCDHSHCKNGVFESCCRMCTWGVCGWERDRPRNQSWDLLALSLWHDLRAPNGFFPRIRRSVQVWNLSWPHSHNRWWLGRQTSVCIQGRCHSPYSKSRLGSSHSFPLHAYSSVCHHASPASEESCQLLSPKSLALLE